MFLNGISLPANPGNRHLSEKWAIIRCFETLCVPVWPQYLAWLLLVEYFNFYNTALGDDHGEFTTMHILGHMQGATCDLGQPAVADLFAPDVNAYLAINMTFQVGQGNTAKTRWRSFFNLGWLL